MVKKEIRHKVLQKPQYYCKRKPNKLKCESV